MKKSIVLVILAVLSIGVGAYFANVNVSGNCCHKHGDKIPDFGTKCIFCKGTGWNGDFNCSACNGTGRNSTY